MVDKDEPVVDDDHFDAITNFYDYCKSQNLDVQHITKSLSEYWKNQGVL